MSAAPERSADKHKIALNGSDLSDDEEIPEVAEPAVRTLRLVYSATGGIGVMPESSLLRIDPELEREFLRLAQQWRCETAHLSVASEKANHLVYHQIMGMGEKVLPLIFRELETATSDWFWALRAITRTSPLISPQDRGNVRKIKAAWLKWGKDHGYVTK